MKATFLARKSYRSWTTGRNFFQALKKWSRVRGGRFRGGPKGPPPPPLWFINYFSITCSLLNVQYGIQTFANFNCLECTRLHLRELQSQKFFRRSMRRNSLEKCAVRNHDGRYRAHIATAYYISRPLYHKILRPFNTLG